MLSATIVVICFQISIFEPLETTVFQTSSDNVVVICFQISIFEPLETTYDSGQSSDLRCDLLSN